MIAHLHTCLALGLVCLLHACSGTNVSTSDGTIPSTDLPPADGAIADLRLESANGDRWYLDGVAEDGSGNLVSVPGHNAFWFA